MDNSIYQDNIEALKEKQPNLVPLIEEVDLSSQDECFVFEGENSSNVLQVKRNDGNYIMYNSFYDPYKEAEEITEHLDYDINRSLIIAAGVGMGYHLKQILANLNEKSVLLAVERNLFVLKNLLCYVDLSQSILDKKILFVIGEADSEDFEAQVWKLMQTQLFNLGSTQAQVLPIKDLDYIKYAKEVFKCIADMKITIFFAMGNDLEDTLVGIDQRIKNLPHMIKNPGLNQFLEKYRDEYKGKPAIIIASGPSLDKNIHILKEAQGKALLLACDGSMDALKKHGVVPDAVGSVERIWLTYEAFYKDKVMPYDTVLVAPAVVRPEIFQSFKTKTLSVFKSENIAGIFNEMACNKGRVFSGASVAHHLMGLAHALGADPIILIGQDLAYAEDGTSHASEVAASVTEKVDPKSVRYYVKGINGNDLPTTYVWKQFLEIYEHFISNQNVNCIDATEGGAYIKGTEVKPLREVIDTYCLEEIPKFRTLIDSLEVGKDEIHKIYLNSMRLVIKQSKRLSLFNKRCQKSMSLNKEAKELLEKGINTQEELDQVYDAIDYTEYKIVRKMAKGRNSWLGMFFTYPLMNVVRRINQLGTEVTLEVLSDNLDIQKELLKIIEEYIERMLDLFSSGFNMLKEEASHEAPGDKDIERLVFPAWLK